VKFGKLTIDPADLGSRANAVLGIRDSGKSVTAKSLAEHLYDHGVPFVAFDPSGVWRFLRVPGRGKGRPVVVAGGLEPDLPLNPATAPQIVEAAMQHGLSLVLDFFGMDLSKGQWRSIVRDCVRLMLRKNLGHGLRHVFLEEAAEFVPQRVQDGLVYAEVEKLARIGGNAGLGLTLINQRAEEVNKAVLELCDNLFLHRTKGKNSLLSLTKWLELGAVKDTRVVIESLSTLPTGECWAWLREHEQPERIHAPMTTSLHPDRRTMRGEVKIGKQAVDVKSVVSKLLGDLPKIEAEAKANDPAELKREIARLKASSATPVTPVALQAEYQKGYRAGQAFTERRIEDAHKRLEVIGREIEALVRSMSEKVANGPVARSEPKNVAKGPIAPVERPVMGNGRVSTAVTKPQAAILDALAFLASRGETMPSKAQVALWAGVSPGSGSYSQNLAKLKEDGLVEYPSGAVALTDHGRTMASVTIMSERDMHDRLYARITTPQASIMRAVLGAWPSDIEKDVLAEGINVAPGSGSFSQNLAKLKAMGVLDYPTPRRIKATAICFLDGK
jgi:hypothetical protein